MPENILYIEDLVLDFPGKTGKKTVLDHLNLTQKKGEWLALIGPKGAGKTSLGLIIKGILTPTQGKLKMFSECPEEDLKQRKIKIGFLFSQNSKTTLSFNVLHANVVDYQIDGSPDLSTSERVGETDLHVPPAFVSPEGDDYRLQPETPLINLGGYAYLGALPPITAP